MILESRSAVRLATIVQCFRQQPYSDFGNNTAVRAKVVISFDSSSFLHVLTGCVVAAG